MVCWKCCQTPDIDVAMTAMGWIQSLTLKVLAKRSFYFSGLAPTIQHFLQGLGYFRLAGTWRCRLERALLHGGDFSP